MTTHRPPTPHRPPSPILMLGVMYCFPLIVSASFAGAAAIRAWGTGEYWQAVVQPVRLLCNWAMLVLYGLPLAVVLAARLWSRAGAHAGAQLPTGEALLWFETLDPPRRHFALTPRELSRPLFISGRPGAGKTTLAAALAIALMRDAAEHGRRRHSVIFDVQRQLAGPVAAESRRLGRRPLVLELGNPEACLPLVVPRPGEDGVDAFVESIRKAWFSHEAELPVQLRDVLRNTFGLLGAAGYGPDQALRALLSPAFQDELLRQAPDRLAPHAGEWLQILRGLSETERYRKLASTLARLFHLLQSRALRRALSGRGHGGFNLERLLDPLDPGPPIDLIITARPGTSSLQSYFFAGIVFNELFAVLRHRLSRPDGPEVAVLIDESPKYGAPEALLELLSGARNTGVQLILVSHSLALLDEPLQRQLVASAAGRILGSETGPGAEAAAAQLYRYQPDLAVALGPDGQPSRYWSAADQEAAFLDRLRHLPDFEFLVRLPGMDEPLWARPLYAGRPRPPFAALAPWLGGGEPGGRPLVSGAAERIPGWSGREGSARPLIPELSVSEAEQALAEAAREYGQPVAALDAALERENQALDTRFGSIAHSPAQVGFDPSDRSWQDRPDREFAPW